MVKVYLPSFAICTLSLVANLLSLGTHSAIALTPEPIVLETSNKQANEANSADVEPEILAEINRVRTNPQGYAHWLEEQKQYYDRVWLKLPGEKPIRSHRLEKAIDEAIAVLKEQKPLPALSISEQTAANASQKLEDFAAANKNIQNISYGRTTAKGIVMSLVVDELFPDRRRRKSLLSPNVEDTGVVCQSDPRYAKVCAIAYSDSETDDVDTAEVQPENSSPAETETIASQTDTSPSIETTASKPDIPEVVEDIETTEEPEVVENTEEAEETEVVENTEEADIPEVVENTEEPEVVENTEEAEETEVVENTEEPEESEVAIDTLPQPPQPQLPPISQQTPQDNAPTAEAENTELEENEEERELAEIEQEIEEVEQELEEGDNEENEEQLEEEDDNEQSEESAEEYSEEEIEEVFEAENTEEEPTQVATNSDNSWLLENVERGVLEEGDRIIAEDGSFYDSFPLEGKSGESFTISLESEEFDAFVALIDARGNIIEQNDDISEEDSNSRIRVTIPENGTYNVIVNAYDEGGSGQYVLTVSR